jgi:hypothetical protein
MQQSVVQKVLIDEQYPADEIGRSVDRSAMFWIRAHIDFPGRSCSTNRYLC